MRRRRLFGRDDETSDGTPDEKDRGDEAEPDLPEAGPSRATEDGGPGRATGSASASTTRHADEASDGEEESDEPARADGAEDAPGGDADEDDDRADDGEFKEIEFELSDWGARERKLLDEILTGVRVRRVWQAGTLVVSAKDADVVDDLIDEIEDRIALDLRPGVEPVIYDIRDWPDGLEDRFVEVLIENRVPHLRGYQEITIGVDDEERVDEMVEEVTTAWEDEQPTEEELGGPDAQEVLSELFVTSDRLLHDASDKTATVRFDDAARAVPELALPFGFAEGDWKAIKAAVEVLQEQLGDAEAQDTDIEEAATTLRTLLRPLV